MNRVSYMTLKLTKEQTQDIVRALRNDAMDNEKSTVKRYEIIVKKMGYTL